MSRTTLMGAITIALLVVNIRKIDPK